MLSSSHVMHGEFGVLDKTSLNIMSASDDPQQARVVP
jgi:hypothetical protein